jgi:hypothetical protein
VSLARPQLAPLALVAVATLHGSALARAQSRTSLVQAPAPKKGAPTWHFKLSGGGNWYNNPFFAGAAPGTTWSTSGEASLSHEHNFRSGSFTWAGNGGALYYPEVEGLNQPTYGGAVTLAWSPSRSTKINLRQDYQRSNTRNLMSLDPEGLPVPTSGLDNATSSLSFDQRLSRRWEFQVGGTLLYRRYDDPRLIGGEELGLNARLGSLVGRSGLVFVSYQYTASRIVEPIPLDVPVSEQRSTLRSHQGLVGFTHRPVRGLAYEVAGGIGYVEAVQKAYPAGRASIASVGRKASIEARYERSFGQAWGYGQPSVADLFSAIVTWMPVRKLTVSADYNFGYRRNPGAEINTIISWIASAGFGWDVGGGVGFTARYSKERNDNFAAIAPVMGDRVMAGLSWGVDWR